MSISAIKLSFDESMMWLDLSDGCKLGAILQKVICANRKLGSNKNKVLH